MNPMSLLQFKPMLEKFRDRHPKFVEFFGYAGQRVMEGSLIEVSITDPEGHKIITNIKVTEEDLELFQTLGSMMK